MCVCLSVNKTRTHSPGNRLPPCSDVDVVVFGEWRKPPLFTLAKAITGARIAEKIQVIDKARVCVCVCGCPPYLSVCVSLLCTCVCVFARMCTRVGVSVPQSLP